jgi:hypothetical protein
MRLSGQIAYGGTRTNHCPLVAAFYSLDPALGKRGGGGFFCGPRGPAGPLSRRAEALAAASIAALGLVGWRDRRCPRIRDLVCAASARETRSVHMLRPMTDIASPQRHAAQLAGLSRPCNACSTNKKETTPSSFCAAGLRESPLTAGAPFGRPLHEIQAYAPAAFGCRNVARADGRRACAADR